MASKSLLLCNDIPITEGLTLRLPKVNEVLEDEEHYYSIVSALTATPYQYMVWLDDNKIDFTTLSDYDLFRILFTLYGKNEDMSILFGDIDLSDIQTYIDTEHNDSKVLYSKKNNLVINELVYYDLVSVIRKINNFKRVKGKIGNQHAKEYTLMVERRKAKRRAREGYKPFLEEAVIALVNDADFPYDYDSCMDINIYRFNMSLAQISHRINFDNTMRGVYAGTVDTTKLKNKDCLSWIKTA